MTSASTHHRRLRRLSSLAVLVAAAGAIAAPSALARPVDMNAGAATIGTYGQAAKAERTVGIRGHSGPAPYQGAVRTAGVPLAAKPTGSGGGTFSWGAAGIGAGGAVLGTCIILLVERGASRRRVRVSQA